MVMSLWTSVLFLLLQPPQKKSFGDMKSVNEHGFLLMNHLNMSTSPFSDEIDEFIPYVSYNTEYICSTFNGV